MRSPDRDLDIFIMPSLVWLASELQVDVNEDDAIPLVADQLEYVLPRNLAWMIWVEYNGNLLRPTSTYAMNLNTSNTAVAGSTSWRSAASGTPIQYAIEGRSLILNPPPSAASIVTTPTMRWRWIGASDEGWQMEGTPQLSDMDQQLVRYDAAIGYLSAHPTPENAQRIQAYTAEIQRRLPAAKQRWANPNMSFYPTFSPETNGRWIASRNYTPLDNAPHKRYTPFKGEPQKCTSIVWNGYLPESERPRQERVGIG